MEGESVGLIGANGIGKSTILKMMTGLLEHDGTLRMFGLDVCREHLPEIRKRTGYVFQDSDSQLFMPTVYDDLAFAPRNYGMSKEEVESRVEKALSCTGMEHLKHRQNYKMSGGEKRMACIATILTMEPEVILLNPEGIAADGNAEEILQNKELLESCRLELPFCMQGWQRQK